MKLYSKFIFSLIALFFIASCAQAQPQDQTEKSSSQQSDPEVVLTTGHNDQINDIAISDNGRFLASGANNKIIKIWDIATSREFRVLSECDGRVISVKWSPDNIHVGAILYSDELKIWNVITGEVVKTVGADVTARNFDFIDGGKQVVYLNEENYLSKASVFNDSESVVYENAYGISVNTDLKKRVAYVYDHKGTFTTYNIDSGEKTTSWGIFDKMNFAFTKTMYEQKKGLLAFGLDDDMVYVINVPEEKIVFRSKKYDGKVQDITFDSKKTVIFASDHLGHVKGYDYITSKKVYDHYEQFKSVKQMAFHPNGSVLIQVYFDKIEFINPEDSKVSQKLEGIVGKIQKMSLSSSGRYLAAAKTKTTIDVWDLNQNRVINNIQGFFPCQFEERCSKYQNTNP